MLTYEALEAAILYWSESRPEVRAGLVVGSRARRISPPDEWSDLDLILFTEQPESLAADGAWLHSFGEVWLSWLSRSQRGDLEWFVVYAGGVKGDFFLTSVPPGDQADLAAMVASFPYQDVLTRGVRVLFDKTGSTVPGEFRLQTHLELSSHPSEAEFTSAVVEFLLTIIRAVKLIRRAELWQAKFVCDAELKHSLLTMLGWHARAVHGLEHDVWYQGRFLTSWADPHALAALPRTFASYDQEDLSRALLATWELYHWLAQSTAERLGFVYPRQSDGQIIAWVRSQLLHQNRV